MPTDIAAALWIAGSAKVAGALRALGAEAIDSAKLTTEAVVGRRVIIAPSAAKPNPEAAAERDAKRALRLGARSVSVVARPPYGSDAADYLEEANGHASLARLQTCARLVAGAVPPPELTNRREIVLLTPAEVRDRPPHLDLVRDIFPARGIAAVIGPPGCGKSFLMVDLEAAVSQALGQWFGKRAGSGGVVHIGSEGTVSSRMRSYEQHHGRSLDHAALRIIEQPVDLLHPGADITEILERLGDAQTALGGVALTVIDTLNRTMPGGKENAPEDMGMYMSHIGRIVDATDGLVVLVHHTGKNEAAGGRGHSSLLGALDCEIIVTADASGNRLFMTTKQRDGADGIGFGFRLEVVDLGPHPHPQADPDERLTSCVVVPCEAEQHRKEPALTGVAKAALQALHEAVAEHGETMPGTTTIPGGVRATTMDRWRERFALRYGAESKDATRKAFQRGRESLLKASAICISDPYAWVWKQ